LGKIEELGRIVAAAPTHVHNKPVAAPKDTPDETTPEATEPQKGHEYQIQAGDSLSAIIKAFHEKGVKVTLSQVLKANPGLNANTLYVGKTIFIPDAAAK